MVANEMPSNRVAVGVGVVAGAEGGLLARGSPRRTVGRQGTMSVLMGIRGTLMNIAMPFVTPAIATTLSPCQQAPVRVLNLPTRKMISPGRDNLNEIPVAPQPVPEKRNLAPVNAPVNLEAVAVAGVDAEMVTRGRPVPARATLLDRLRHRGSNRRVAAVKTVVAAVTAAAVVAVAADHRDRHLVFPEPPTMSLRP